MIRTKIICTIGPAVKTKRAILALMKEGMNVARINFSHGTDKEHRQMIRLLQEARRIADQPLAILLDTKGPEIRLGKIKDDSLHLCEGHRWLLVKKDLIGTNHRVTVKPAFVLDCLTVGTRLLFNDGEMAARVIEIKPEGVLVEMEDSGCLSSHKGVNVPEVSLNFPSLTQNDVEDIRLGCREGIDMIAASFVRAPENVIAVKNLLIEENRRDVMVIAKIENREGLQNFDAILQVADGIMIARGDLGVEVPLCTVPRWQKEMIHKCYLAGKPAITATQMLQSMVQHPRPTRAEVSDVANAIYDSSSAVMLSGETAVGRYPAETVRMMRTIIEETETHFDYRDFFQIYSGQVYHDVPSAVALAAVKTAYSSDAKAIFAFTTTGITVRVLSRLRPEMPIIAMTFSEESYHQMALQWGVIPILEKGIKNLQDGYKRLSQIALEKGYVSYGDLVIVLSGTTFGISGTTNMMVVENIGDVLVRGHEGVGERVYGNVTLIFSPEGIKPYMVRGRLLVIPKCDETYIPFIEEAQGIILQNHISDIESEERLLQLARELQKPAIVRADGARRILKERQLVTLDPKKALVYKGVVEEEKG